MIRHFRIESIRKDVTPGPKAGWTTFFFNPVENAISYLTEAGKKYRELQPKKCYVIPFVVAVTGVVDEEEAYISIKGRKKDIENFLQTATLVKGFNTYWSWGEVDKWRMELRLR